MEGVLIILVGFVVGILQIILFFKVWSMTTDVGIIKNVICKNKLSKKDIWLFVINETHSDEEVDRLLSENILRDGIELYETHLTDNTGSAYKYSSLKKFYQRMYELRPNLTPSRWLSFSSIHEFKTEIEKLK